MVTPARVPGSLRRTSSIDIVRRDGEAIGLGRARDVRTTADGGIEMLASAEVRHRANETTRRILEISVEPTLDGVDSLVGLTLGSRFRADAHDLLVHGPWDGHPLVLLLDDLPAARFISSYALARRGGQLHFHQPDQVEMRADLCAGWARDGAAFIALESRGMQMVPVGPVAEPLRRGDDPAGWHELRLLPPNSMRRSRRLDVTPGGGDTWGVDAYFRDGHIEDDGREIVLHEYSLTASVDGDVVTAIDVTPGTLPHVDCPAALDSAQRVVGRRLGDLRWWVSAEMTGPSTCTHLNDVLRSLSDLAELRGHLVAD
ncbi:MAG: DUF2889 domain-containing protein [Acidimicrobiales bacterium]